MMVSTRGIRYKFSEGERVLCYEPDPTKAKVLYDSKVLEVIENKDKRGRRSVEYLIHFQGWNSSWDRCVSEDFVLKDTEENRQLQRDLAEKSQLQLGAYLYRRERKKGSGSSSTTTGVGGTNKRARLGFSDDGSSSSTQPEGEGEIGDTDSSSGDASGSQPATPSNQAGRAHVPLPSALRDRLTFDYHLVVKRGRLSQLPASPCAAEILESFVKWYARAGAWHPPRGRHDPPQKPDLLDVSCRLNLVREVADGFRVYFDFILRGHLLYKQEHQQYHEICGKFLDAQDALSPDDFPLSSMKMDHDSVKGATEDILKSPRIPEYSHLPPDPNDDKADVINKQASSSNLEEAPKIKLGSSDKPLAVLKAELASNEDNQHATPGAASVPKTRENRSAPRIGIVARRLRSHKSAVSQSETDEPTPSTSAGEPRAFETVSSSMGSSGSSGEGWPRPALAAAPTATRTPLSLLLDKVAKWQIVSREGTDHLPCRVYGAIHLARLFVKLPDFLNATQMPDFKLKLILKHIDMFVQYLDEHSEWFGENYYIADSASRSH